MSRLLDIEVAQLCKTMLAKLDNLATYTSPIEIAHPKVISTKIRDTNCC